MDERVECGADIGTCTCTCAHMYIPGSFLSAARMSSCLSLVRACFHASRCPVVTDARPLFLSFSLALIEDQTELRRHRVYVLVCKPHDGMSSHLADLPQHCTATRHVVRRLRCWRNLFHFAISFSGGHTNGTLIFFEFRFPHGYLGHLLVCLVP